MTDAASAIAADPNVPTSVIVLLGIAVSALAGVIAYLFKYYSGRMKESEDHRLKSEEVHAQERQTWAVERERLGNARNELRLEFEVKHREMLERAVDAMRELEAKLRAEYVRLVESVEESNTTNMKILADKADEANQRMSTVMEKLATRFSQRPRGKD